MSKFIVTEVKLYKVEGKDKDEALANFHANDDIDDYLLDVEVTIDPYS